MIHTGSVKWLQSEIWTSLFRIRHVSSWMKPPRTLSAPLPVGTVGSALVWTPHHCSHSSFPCSSLCTIWSQCLVWSNFPKISMHRCTISSRLLCTIVLQRDFKWPSAWPPFYLLARPSKGLIFRSFIKSPVEFLKPKWMWKGFYSLCYNYSTLSRKQE